MEKFENLDQEESREKEWEDREKLRNLNNSDLAIFLLGWLAVFYDAQGVNLGRSTRSNLLDCVLVFLRYSEEGGEEIGDARTIPYFAGLEEAEERIKAGKIPAKQTEMESPLNSVKDLSSERLVCELLNFLLEEQEKTDKKNEIADFDNLCRERKFIKTASLLLPKFEKCPFSSLELMQEVRRRWEIKRADEEGR